MEESFKSTTSRTTYSSKEGKRQIAVIKEGELIKKISVEQKEFFIDLELEDFIDFMQAVLSVCKDEGIFDEVQPLPAPEEADEKGEKFKY